MKVKNDYQECLTNLACSIRKYFNLEYKHNTLDYIDKILEERKPKNVVTILFDGMGSNIIDKILPSDSFLIRHRLKPITTVFPATTVAATTSILTGLNPVETGMLGWNMYLKGIDKIVTAFYGVEKGDETETPLEEAINYKAKYMKTRSITEEINLRGEDKGYGLFPFGDDAYEDVDEMFERIVKLCNMEGKKYIYAYDDEPDHSMHEKGTYCKQIRDMIRYRNIMVERLAPKLKDTVIFVVADHGHIPVENIHLENYPKILECLERETAIEPRATAFFVKEEKKDEFEKLFQKEFSEYYDLHTKKDVIESKLFGDGEENPIFRDALGDYLAIAKTNKVLLSKYDKEFKSHHAGYMDDEILVPLIVI
ncbi:MAG: alkaline phosphatase family protein [Clostridia bacterium]|nr:alkaline phosphatase family protein [Clostridia bacterium]